jgi:hypothetical protein
MNDDILGGTIKDTIADNNSTIQKSRYGRTTKQNQNIKNIAANLPQQHLYPPHTIP